MNNTSQQLRAHPAHRACYIVLRFVMESGTKGCKVIVSSKLPTAHAKSMKFTDGWLHDPLRPASTQLCRLRHPARPPLPGRLQHQGQDVSPPPPLMQVLADYPEGYLAPASPDFVQIPVDKIVSESSSEQRELVAMPALAPPAEDSAVYQPHHISPPTRRLSPTYYLTTTSSHPGAPTSSVTLHLTTRHHPHHLTGTDALPPPPHKHARHVN
jgi:hypothetical protein